MKKPGKGLFPRSGDTEFILAFIRSPDILLNPVAAFLSHRRNNPAENSKSQLTQEN